MRRSFSMPHGIEPMGNPIEQKADRVDLREDAKRGCTGNTKPEEQSLSHKRIARALRESGQGARMTRILTTPTLFEQQSKN